VVRGDEVLLSFVELVGPDGFLGVLLRLGHARLEAMYTSGNATTTGRAPSVSQILIQTLFSGKRIFNPFTSATVLIGLLP